MAAADEHVWAVLHSLLRSQQLEALQALSNATSCTNLLLLLRLLLCCHAAQYRLQESTRRAVRDRKLREQAESGGSGSPAGVNTAQVGATRQRLAAQPASRGCGYHELMHSFQPVCCWPCLAGTCLYTCVAACARAGLSGARWWRHAGVSSCSECGSGTPAGKCAWRDCIPCQHMWFGTV